jgi:hypothetical protein
MKHAAFTILLLLSSCSLGPIHITHTYGEPPKVHVDTGIDGCAFRPRIGGIGGAHSDELNMVCKWDSTLLD